jgi:hypothetical protein
MSETTTQRIHHRLVDRLSPWMFALSLTFLAMIATLIVLWVDVPRVAEDASKHTSGRAVAAAWGDLIMYLCLLLWPIFWVDFVMTRLACPREDRRWRDGLLSCVIPPLRLGARNPEMGSKTWLPFWNWCDVNDDLRKRLSKAFGGPMIAIALMILPVLLIEFTMQARIRENLWLKIILHFGTGIIWFAFASEFIVMYSVAEKKLAYCKEHWVDLVIILLPLVSFLRSLRAIRALRVAKLAKAQQITRMGRIYRLRGLAVKAFRAMLLFEVVYRITGITPQKRLDRLRLTLGEKEAEIEDLQEQIIDLESIISRQSEAAKSEAAKSEAAKSEAAKSED